MSDSTGYKYWAYELHRLIDDIEAKGHEVSVERDGSLRVWDLNMHNYVALRPTLTDGWHKV